MIQKKIRMVGSFGMGRTQLRGASGYILLMDGTRLSTLDGGIDLQARVAAELGPVPFTCVVNKLDLRLEWPITDAALDELRTRGWQLLLTSAKTGEEVEALFTGLAECMLAWTAADA